MVREGYKRTEVGIIPQDWRIALLDSLAKRGSGHTPNKKHPEYWDGNIKWISLRDSEFLDAIYISETVARISQKGLENSSAVLHPAGTVVLSRDAGVGKSAIMAEAMAVSQHFIAWQCSSDLNNLYLYYWLQATKSEFERIAIGSTIKTIGLPYFAGLKIPLPTLLEQQAIAEALSDVDALIAGLDKLIAKKRAIKTGTMQQLLTGEKRLPGFGTGQGYRRTEFGEIPEDWDVKPLISVSTLNGRIGWQGLKQSEFTSNPDDPFLITGMNFKDGEIRWEEVYHISTERYKIAPNIQLRAGDVLMTKDGTIGKLLYVDEIPYPGKASLNSHLLLFRPIGGQYIPKFLFYQLGFKTFFEHIELNKSGSTFFGITQEAIGKYKAFLPPIPEQLAIAEVLSDMDSEIAALEARRAKTQAVKQGMMQELLTGRTRIV